MKRWVLRMQPYKFKVRYQPGPKNITDSLSRLVSSEESGSKHSSQTEEYIRFVAVSATPSAMTTHEVEDASAEDEELSATRTCINGEPWGQLVYKQYLPCSGELCTIGQLKLRGKESSSRRNSDQECYPSLMKAMWVSLGLNKRP